MWAIPTGISSVLKKKKKKVPFLSLASRKPVRIRQSGRAGIRGVTGSLYSFEVKVLRVLLQLESPKSEHRNSSYVINNRDYSMFKNRTRNWLEHGPTLSEFLGHVDS